MVYGVKLYEVYDMGQTMEENKAKREKHLRLR